ncbi:hypothetical protein KP509_22G050700 [Ceratopteris richardii]|uniref:Pentatricopeptide repeat-containing protein n=1 Tax=Ceratopteris richardii TaxID=49495 RepID=A0A8T2S858_CERRI|nr:hypothetical protein KP509_22G050700 [Ceratopteris richardii]
MYAKFGLPIMAQEVFDKLVHRDVVIWTALIACLTEAEYAEKAIKCFERMKLEGISPDFKAFTSVLRACGKSRDIIKGHEVHVKVCEVGGSEGNVFIGSTLVDMYAKCGTLTYAHEVFDKLMVRNDVSWTTLIKGYIEVGFFEDAMNCFEQMQLEGVCPDSITFICILNSCSKIGRLQFRNDHRLGCALVEMYGRIGALQKAHEVFEYILVKDIDAWNALIAAYGTHGCVDDTVRCFKEMEAEGISPNLATYVSLSKAYIATEDINKATEVLAEIQVEDLSEVDAITGSSLIDAYAKCGLMEKATKVFDKLPSRNIVTWNTLITACVENGCNKEALCYFDQMQCEGVFPDAITFICCLKACGNLVLPNRVNELYSQIKRLGLLDRDQALKEGAQQAFGGGGIQCGKRPGREEFLIPWDSRERGGDIGVCHIRGIGGVSWLVMLEGIHQEGCALSCGGSRRASAGVLAERGRGRGTNPSSRRELLGIRPSEIQQQLGESIHLEEEQRRLCEHVCGSKEMTDTKVATNQADRCLSSLYVEVDKGGVTSSTDTARASESKDTGSHDRDLIELVKSLECQVNWLHVERDNERIKIEKLEENQVKMAEVLGIWEKQVRILKNENKEWKRVNKSWRQDLLKLESENVVWDLRSGLMVADCFGVAIEEELSRDEDGLMRRVEGMEHEIEKVQSIIRRYSDQAGFIEEGLEIYVEICRWDLHQNVYIGSSLIDLYTKFGLLIKAREVFDGLLNQDVVSWTALIGGLSEKGICDEALEFFHMMQFQGVFPDAVSWNVVTSAFVEQEESDRAHIYFKQMQEQGLMPTIPTFLSMIKACGSTASLDTGRRFHSQLKNIEWEDNEAMLMAALIDMYGKCGYMAGAQQLFNDSPSEDGVIWNALISGYTGLGQDQLAFYSLKEMMNSKITKPDESTFVIAITMCTHVGSVESGLQFFESVSKDYNIQPTMKHYNCLLDLLGRAGRIHEAVLTIGMIPFEVDTVIWSTILSACYKWGNIDLGKHAFQHAMRNDELAATFILIIRSKISHQDGRPPPLGTTPVMLIRRRSMAH